MGAIECSGMGTFITVIGLVIGSFLSVCIYRIPLGRKELYDSEGEIVAPPQAPGLNAPNPSSDGSGAAGSEKAISLCSPSRSFCPACGKQLLWWHNIPVISWFLLGGKCGFCKARVSFRYPLVEILSGLLAYLSYSFYGVTLTALVIFIFSATLLVISFIDYDYFIIPNSISLPGFAIGVGIAAINEFTGIFALPIAPGLLTSLLGVLFGAGFLLLVSEVYFRLRKKEGLGMGDIKLLAMVGALFGPQAAIYTIFIGSLLGAIIGVTLLLILGRRLTQHLPFGPYLAFATLLYLFGFENLIADIGMFVAMLLG